MQRPPGQSEVGHTTPSTSGRRFQSQEDCAGHLVEARVSKRSDSDCSCLETGFLPPGDRCSHQVMESDHPEVKGVTFESLGNHLIAAVCNQSETAKRINTITDVCCLTRALFPSSLSSNFSCWALNCTFQPSSWFFQQTGSDVENVNEFIQIH